jgi:hypothetical protein
MATREQKQERDARLDRLKQAVDEWHTNERGRYEAEATFLKSFLRGRTGSERLSRENTAEAEALVVDDITSFLSG